MGEPAESTDRTSEAATRRAALRTLPAIDALVRDGLSRWAGRAPAAGVTAAARRRVDAWRAALRDGRESVIDPARLEAEIDAQVARLVEDRLRPVINGTGILLHTNLGRSALPAAAAAAMGAAAEHPVPVELDLASGRRGRRTEHVAELLVALTGAEAATVVNNGAGALLLALAATAAPREVIVSRGELVEIGGSYRLPEVIETGGGRLREVGTTNRTRAADYERAAAAASAEGAAGLGAILKVHASNYRIEGFTAAAGVAELAPIARRWDVPLVHDIGSGRLDRAIDVPGLPDDEPDAVASIRDGADLVIFSGDKLLGGPQAGIVVGRRDLIARMDRHPLHRALRVDAVTLAGLAAVLRIHLDPARAAAEIPAIAAARTPVAALQSRAENLVAGLHEYPGPGGLAAEIAPGTAYLGGGTAPAQALPSVAIALRPSPGRGTEEALASRLRRGRPGVVGRVQDGRVWVDLRSVPPERDAALLAAIREAAEPRPAESSGSPE
jgi:L-seryl-tRNA(Ser) seleniumtransferase